MNEPKDSERPVHDPPKLEPKEDACPLCDGTGVFSAVEPEPGKVYLCGACERGDPENCSGWCGVQPFPVKEGPTVVEPPAQTAVGYRSEGYGFESGRLNIDAAFWATHAVVERHSPTWDLRSDGRSMLVDPTGSWIEISTYCRDMSGLERRLAQWEDAAKAVGISSPGGMQQARHMAVMACAALDLDYDETSPEEIREAIEAMSLRTRRAEAKAAKAQMLLKEDGEMEDKLLAIERELDGVERKLDAANRRIAGLEQDKERLRDYANLKDLSEDAPRARMALRAAYARANAAELRAKKADARIAELEQLEDSLLEQKRRHEVNEGLKAKLDEAERDEVMLFDECQRLKRLYREMKTQVEGKATNEPNGCEECEELKARVAELLEEAECATAREVSLCEAANRLGVRVKELEAELRIEQAAHDRNDRSSRERLAAADDHGRP